MSTFVEDPFEPPLEFRLLLGGPDLVASPAQREALAARLDEFEAAVAESAAFDGTELCRLRVHESMWALCMRALGARLIFDVEWRTGVNTLAGIDHSLAWYAHKVLQGRRDDLPECRETRCEECPWRA